MSADDDIRNLMERISKLANPDHPGGESEQIWLESAAQIFVSIEETILKSERVNQQTPKDYTEDKHCPLATVFQILPHISNPNHPYLCSLYDDLQKQSGLSDIYTHENKLSFYELAYSRCCAFITQILGDRFAYVQKLMIKHIFSPNNICSMMASDIYIFLMRNVHPNRKMSMCLLIMNLCKLAPPEAVVKGAALINRIKHPIVNFQNSNYQHILDFTT